MRVKEESEKAGLKLNIHKTKIMASNPITSWQIEVEKWKQWQIFSFWAPKSLLTVTTAMKFKEQLMGQKKLKREQKYTETNKNGNITYQNVYSKNSFKRSTQK